MVEWEWTRNAVEPGDVLDAARSIPVTSNWIMTDLTADWVEARRYLDWANAALLRADEHAWDSAAGLAKRAVCRQMDGILVHSHLGRFLGQNYKKKTDYLSKLKVPGLSLIRDIIIDPRNDIEHAYILATESQARRACELAELFLRATDVESSRPGVATLGWNINYSARCSSKPGNEYEIHEFALKHDHGPTLLIDEYAESPEILVLYPKEETLSVCPRDSFESDQILNLNSRLRESLKFKSYSSHQFNRRLMKTLREQLRL